MTGATTDTMPGHGASVRTISAWWSLVSPTRSTTPARGGSPAGAVTRRPGAAPAAPRAVVTASQAAAAGSGAAPITRTVAHRSPRKCFR